MPVQTRSITRQLFLKDTSMASFKLDVLKTPGIVSQIAKHLEQTDETLVSLFLTVNDVRFRHEMMPYCQTFKDAHTKVVLMIEKARKMQMIQKHLQTNLMEFINIADLCEGYAHKKIGIIGIYEYLCDNVDDLHLLGKQFGKTIGNKIIDVLNDMEHDDEDFYLLMLSYEETLRSYLIWAWD